MNKRKTFKQISRQCGWKNYYLCYYESAIGIQTPSGLWHYRYFNCGSLNDMNSDDIADFLTYNKTNYREFDYCLLDRDELLSDGYTTEDVDFIEEKLIELYIALEDEEQKQAQEWLERQRQLTAQLKV